MNTQSEPPEDFGQIEPTTEDYIRELHRPFEQLALKNLTQKPLCSNCGLREVYGVGRRMDYWEPCLWETLLGKMIANGEGRRPVCISKTTFTHPCEGDGATILNVQDAFLQMGGTKVNKNGSESMRGCLVLVGDEFWIRATGHDPKA
jgi:hypothetical protein